MDLFYLSDDISAKSNYKYVVSIIDHFSKLIWSYAIKEKTAHDCLLCLMHYVYAFGCPKNSIPTTVKNSKIFILIFFVLIIIKIKYFQSLIIQNQMDV